MVSQRQRAARRAVGPLTGRVERVVDGDTLDLGGQRIRLAGMDAPEKAQTCTDRAGEGWPCGTRARDRLARLVAGQALSCRPLDHDRYGRLVAICTAPDGDVGRRLVAEGLAVARDRYLAEEAAARKTRSGVFQGAFIDPADWRRDRVEIVEQGGRPSRFDRFIAWLGSWLGG